MTQAIEIAKVRRCEAPRLSLLGRLRVRLFGPAAPRETIPLELRSVHLLRDIGLSEDIRHAEMLRERHLFRR